MSRGQTGECDVQLLWGKTSRQLRSRGNCNTEGAFDIAKTGTESQILEIRYQPRLKNPTHFPSPPMQAHIPLWLLCFTLSYTILFYGLVLSGKVLLTETIV